MKNIIKIFLVAGIILITPGYVMAGRPLATSDTATIDKGTFELEVGYEYVKHEDEENNFSIALTYGVLNNLEVGIELPYTFIDYATTEKVDGIGDLSIGLKYRLWDEVGNFPSGALSFSIKTQTGDEDKGLGTGEVDYEICSIFTKQIGPMLIHMNAGYTFKGEPEGRDIDDVFLYNFALEYPVGNFNLVGEIVGETTFEGNFDANPCEGLIGFNYPIKENLVYDFGINFPISEVSPDYRITTGLTISW